MQILRQWGQLIAVLMASVLSGCRPAVHPIHNPQQRAADATWPAPWGWLQNRHPKPPPGMGLTPADGASDALLAHLVKRFEQQMRPFQSSGC